MDRIWARDGTGYAVISDAAPWPAHRPALPQANVHVMLQRRTLATGIRTRISAHSFRATGITTYLQNGGKLEVAQQMAGHESARTTGLYNRRNDDVALDEMERIAY
jgi:integrase/recombinase XerD